MQIIDFGNAVNYGSEQFFMYSMIVTECFHNKCFKPSTLYSVYIPWGCELDMILSVMTIILSLLTSILIKMLVQVLLQAELEICVEVLVEVQVRTTGELLKYLYE